MKTKEEIYREYSDNPIAWMEKHNCDTTKKVTLELMEQNANQSKWISVEERFPEVENEKFNDSDYMLCIDMDGDSVPFVAWYNKLANKWTVSHPYSLSSPAKVTHYQPLPAIPSPPKTEK